MSRVFVLAALVLGLVCPAVAAAIPPSESSTFQVDGGHTGYLSGAGVVPPLHRAWSFATGRSNDVIAVDAGRAYVFGSSGKSTITLDAVNLSTGTLAWSTALSATTGTLELASDQGRVYVAQSAIYPANSAEAAIILSAFDEATGKLDWTTPLTEQSQPTWLAPETGTLYFEAEGLGGNVYAINESTGARIWTSQTLFDGNPVTVAGNTLVVSGTCGLSYGLSRATGAIVWSDSNGCSGGGDNMASYDGTSVWGDDWALPPNRIYNAGTGAVLGRFTGDAPAFGYGTAIQAVQAEGGAVSWRGINPSTQAVRWTLTDPAGTYNPSGSDPLLADGYAFVEGSRGTIWALHPCSGTVAWSGTAAGPPPFFADFALPSLAAGDGYLLAGTPTGLTAFKGSGGTAPRPACTTSGR